MFEFINFFTEGFIPFSNLSPRLEPFADQIFGPEASQLKFFWRLFDAAPIRSGLAG